MLQQQHNVTSVHLLPAKTFKAAASAHLLIKEDINDGIVDGGGFREDGWYGRQSQVERLPTVVDDPESKGGVWHVAHQEAQHHDDHHPGHLFFCLLGGGGLSLGLCCLLTHIYCQT